MLKIERNIREIKERIRCTKMIMKFKIIPKQFAIEMVKNVTIYTIN